MSKIMGYFVFRLNDFLVFSVKIKRNETKGILCKTQNFNQRFQVNGTRALWSVLERLDEFGVRSMIFLRDYKWFSAGSGHKYLSTWQLQLHLKFGCLSLLSCQNSRRFNYKRRFSEMFVPDRNVSPFARARNICCGHKFCVRDTKNVFSFARAYSEDHIFTECLSRRAPVVDHDVL